MHQNIRFSPSQRRHLLEYIGYAILIALLSFAPVLIPDKGIMLINLRGSNDIVLTQSITTAISVILIIICLVVMIYTYFETYFFKILLTPKLIEFKQGIFSIKIESIDMHIIRDFAKNRSFLDQIFGLSNILIHSEDIRTPEVTFSGLDVRDAEVMLKYLQSNASSTIVEYLMGKDNERRHSAATFPEA